jgi:hypothetical protein
MKTPAIQNQLFYPIYVRKKTQKTDVNHDCKKFDIPYAYYPPSLSFGIANSGKLKTLFTYELPCMYTGIDMIDPKKIQKMLKNNLFDGPISAVIARLQPFKKSLQQVELNIFNILEEQAKFYPEKTVEEIIQSLVPTHRKELRRRQSPIIQELIAASRDLPEEYRYKFKQFIEEAIDKLDDRPILVPYSRTEFKYKLEKIQEDVDKNKNLKATKAMRKLIEVSEKLTTKEQEISTEEKLATLDFMEKILKTSVLKENPQLKQLFQNARMRLNGEKLLIPFSRKGFIYDLEKLLTDLPDTELKENMIAIAEKLPTSRDVPSAYIMKHRNDPSEKIIYKLLWPSLASVEHIHPRACGGPDAMSNFGGACTRVNSDRSCMDFTEYMKINPHIQENCQKYVDRLIELAKAGVFEKNYIDTKYIEEFKMAIYEESKGAINLDISKLYE